MLDGTKLIFQIQKGQCDGTHKNHLGTDDSNALKLSEVTSDSWVTVLSISSIVLIINS